MAKKKTSLPPDFSKQIKAVVEAQIKGLEVNREKIETQRLLAAQQNPNCLSYWFPKIKDLPGILTPKTFIYPVHFRDQIALLDGQLPESILTVIEQMKAQALSLGYPVFVKNSLFSGKHQWSQTCAITRPEDFLSHLQALTDMSYGVGVDDSLYWILREMLPTTPAFFAFDGLPITRERRYFVEEGKVIFHHPYWPPHSIQNPSIKHWPTALKKLNQETATEIKHLRGLTEIVGRALGGAWSIDWLQTTDGRWYLIDMAQAHKSFRWQDYTAGTRGLK